MKATFIAIWVAVVATLTPTPALAAPGTAVEFFNASMGHYFVTAFPEEAAAIDAGKVTGWQRTGLTFPVEMTSVAGTQPVCRFFTTAFAPKSSHFYTPNAGECESLKANPVWQYEAIAFHLSLPGAGGTCPVGMTAIYRFYNNGTTGAPNHRYTADALVVKTMKAQGWTQEGDGTTGVFACGPAATPTKTSLSVRIEYNPGVRFLSTADGAALTSQTESSLTFAHPISVFVGDVFVVPEIGAWRALSVQQAGGQTVVGVQPASLTELFADIDIAGTVDIGDAAEVPEDPAAVVQPNLSAKALLETETKTTFVITTNANGDKVGKFTAKLQAACGPNPSAKMRLLEITGEISGVQAVKYSLKDPASSGFGPLKYKVTGGAYIGCKVSLPLGTLKLLDLPIAQTAGLARVQLFAKAKLDTDIAPVLQLVEVNVDGMVPSGSNAPVLQTANPSLAESFKGISVGTTYGATLTGELDASLKLIIPPSFYVLGGGVKTGPALSFKATGVSKPSGVDFCAELKWPTELYTEHRTSTGVQHKAWFQTDYPVALPDGWKNCAAGNEPSGDWRFTTKSCVKDPANCDYACADTIDFTLSANADKSRINQFYPVGTQNLYLTLEPLGTTPRMYLGSVTEGVPVVQTMQFGNDWKTATWDATVVFPTQAGICVIQQGGDAVLTKAK